MYKGTRTLALFAALAILAVASLVVACSGGDKPTAPATATAATTAPAASSDSAADPYGYDAQYQDQYAVHQGHDRGRPAAVAAFHDAMRKLWEDHITWTRLFIVSASGDLPDKDATTARLLQNQVDIGNAVKPYYGDAAGAKLTALLQDHILIAGDLLGAAKAGDKAATDDASARWYANANEIATFLSTANPKNWPSADMPKMMKDHLDLTLEEAVAHLTGDYPADVAAYDKVHDEILAMADMLSDGIVKQFPQQFS